MGLHLEVEGLGKIYGATKALHNVSFSVVEGSVHALMGENGAGKSTLIKILSGLERADAGSMTLGGATYHPGSVKESRNRGVSTAFQELSLLPNLTVAENLCMPNLLGGRKVLYSSKNNVRRAEEILASYKIENVSPKQKVGELSLANKQKVEIARAMSLSPKLLLLDEPTAALPDPEWLFDLLERIKGTATVMYISHRLDEVRSLCSSATVLRNGQVVSNAAMGDVSDGEILRLMAGRNVVQVGGASNARNLSSDYAKRTLETRGLSGLQVRDVNIAISSGEIVGVAGLEGQGQAELFHMLAGLQKPMSGEILLDGNQVRFRSPKKALRHGVSFIPEERKVDSIFPGLSTPKNVSMSSLEKVSLSGFISNEREHRNVESVSVDVQLDERYFGKTIESLSGGNQQKAILARVLLTGVPFVLAFDPSRGVDIGTKSTFYETTNRFCFNGGSVLWYSTDLAELVSICDRVLVFYRGEIVADVSRELLNNETLLSYATGHYKEAL